MPKNASPAASVFAGEKLISKGEGGMEWESAHSHCVNCTAPPSTGAPNGVESIEN